jgi:hypothetical protein
MRIIYITDRDRQYDPRMGATNPDPGAISIRESRGQISILFAFLMLVSAVALARVVPNAHTTAGRVTGVVIFGVLLAVFAVGWIVTIRRPGRLEIGQDTIRYVQGNGQAAALSRKQGNRLRWVKQRRGRLGKLGLTIEGTDAVMTLGLFSRKAVQQACLARGWRFADKSIVRR